MAIIKRPPLPSAFRARAMSAESKIEAHIEICVVRYDSINARLKRLEQIMICTTGFIIVLLLGLVLKSA